MQVVGQLSGATLPAAATTSFCLQCLAYRSISVRKVQLLLREERLLPRLNVILRRQLCRCSDESLKNAAFALSVLIDRCHFRPSERLLLALDDELLFRLSSSSRQAIIRLQARANPIVLYLVNR